MNQTDDEIIHFPYTKGMGEKMNEVCSTWIQLEHQNLMSDVRTNVNWGLPLSFNEKLNG